MPQGANLSVLINCFRRAVTNATKAAWENKTMVFPWYVLSRHVANFSMRWQYFPECLAEKSHPGAIMPQWWLDVEQQGVIEIDLGK